MIFVTATEQSGVLGAGFQIVAFPAAKDKARFLVSIQCEVTKKARKALPSVDGNGKVEGGENGDYSEWVGNCKRLV
jgi:hypothetical protein